MNVTAKIFFDLEFIGGRLGAYEETRETLSLKVVTEEASSKSDLSFMCE